MMWNVRFCQKRLFVISGLEIFVQFGIPAGQAPLAPVNAVLRLPVCGAVSRPAGWLVDVVMGWHVVSAPTVVQFGGPTLACAAASVLNSTPDDAVASFETTVLLMKLTFTASCSDTPPPAQPATLLPMMLLITRTAYHLLGSLGLRCTSVPLTCCSLSPPPLPLSAVLPISRLLSITRPGPAPSDNCGAQSTSTVAFSQNVPSGGTPWAMMPPP